jgi:hypothetical protein
MIRKAKAVWRGTGRAGSGNLSTDSGVLANTPYSFKTRFENEKGASWIATQWSFPTNTTSLPRTIIRPLVKLTSSRICNSFVPTRLPQGGRDELGANIAFAEGFLVHRDQSVAGPDPIMCSPLQLSLVCPVPSAARILPQPSPRRPAGRALRSARARLGRGRSAGRSCTWRLLPSGSS